MSGLLGHISLLTGGAAAPAGTHLVIAHSTTPFITIYKRSGTTFTKLSDPASLPTSTSNGASFSPDGTFLAVAHNGGAFITIYSVSGDTFTKLSNPASLPAAAAGGVAWSPDGTMLAVAHQSSPFVTIYSRSGSTFTKLTNPGTLPGGDGRGCAFSADGTLFAVAHSTTPFITIYSVSGSTFTKLSDPATLPSSSQPAFNCAFAGDGAFLVVASGTASPNITIYAITAGPTFTKITNPSLATSFDTSWTPASDYMGAGAVYSRSGSTFTEVSRPAIPGGGTALGGAFSPDGGLIAYGTNASPFVAIYTLAGGVLTLLGDPATLPAGVGRGVAWNPV